MKSSGPQPPGPKPPVNRHDLKHTQPSRTSPAPNHLYSIVFCHRGGPPWQPRPSWRWKAPRGGGLCHNYFPTRFGRFSESAFSLSRVSYRPLDRHSGRSVLPSGVTAMRWTDKRVRLRAVFADAVSGGTPKEARGTDSLGGDPSCRLNVPASSTCTVRSATCLRSASITGLRTLRKPRVAQRSGLDSEERLARKAPYLAQIALCPRGYHPTGLGGTQILGLSGSLDGRTPWLPAPRARLDREEQRRRARRVRG